MKTLTLSDYTITMNGEVINNHTGRKVKPELNGKGYLRVTIGGKRYFIHRLVAQFYLPNPEQKPQINHKDGNKLNNSVENLEWATNSENRAHALRNRLHLCGEDCSWSKLTQKDVEYIRSASIPNKTTFAQQFNVTRTTINDVLSRRSWK